MAGFDKILKWWYIYLIRLTQIWRPLKAFVWIKLKFDLNLYDQGFDVLTFSDIQISEKQSINREQLESAANVTLMTSEPKPLLDHLVILIRIRMATADMKK